MAHNSITFVLIGATGDLATRKLIPALYSYLNSHKDQNILFVAAGKEETSIDAILQKVLNYIPHDGESPTNSDVWKLLTNNSFYHQIDAQNVEDFITLQEIIARKEQSGNYSGNRLLYLATPSSLFADITIHAVQSRLITRTQPNDAVWHRVVYEKPFGHDYHSALAINKIITSCIAEHQIYRIDHYLAKQMVQNISEIRFANPLFSAIWNNKHIAFIYITLYQQDTLGSRIFSYESYGALRDVVQNHLLQLTALVTMQSGDMNNNNTTELRTKALQELYVQEALLGQCVQYAQQLAKPSCTETFSLLTLGSRNEQWQGVPILVGTGKYLKKDESKISIYIKATPGAQGSSIGTCQPQNNILTISLGPQQSIRLQLHVQQGKLACAPIELCAISPKTKQAYEILIKEIITAQCCAAVGMEEIEAAWNIIDPIYQQKLPIFSYEQGTMGPAQAQTYITNKLQEY